MPLFTFSPRNALLGALLLVLGAGFFFMLTPRVIRLEPGANAPGTSVAPAALPPLVIPEAAAPTSSPPVVQNGKGDIAKQSPLADPPQVVKGIYLTGWSAGSSRKVRTLLDLAKRTELNAMVIDIKDYSGYVSYAMDVPDVGTNGAERELRIARPNALIKELHDNGIYAIARISVFQDPVLARARPEWALTTASGTLWADRKGLNWVDPASEGVWDYHAAIARDAFARGFDEVNFDYVRFPSDGDLSDIRYPFWDGHTPRHAVLKKFFSYLRSELKGAVISVDLFGLATVNSDDLGIGQIIEDAYENFDYVSPMVYPSHYAAGFLGYTNPALYPYEVIRYSLEAGLKRLVAFRDVPVATSTATSSVPAGAPAPSATHARLRPWLQSFNIGAVYSADMIRKEIQATEDVLMRTTSTPAGDMWSGWLLWDPNNVYVERSLLPEL